jgi:putative toxin-antitoxin system antitoxin component (TIGR02293 family)
MRALDRNKTPQLDKPIQGIAKGVAGQYLMGVERIPELAEVIQLGLEVFGDVESLKRWLDTPVFALDNHKPADLLRDSFGKELVVGELTRIEHGIFS